LPSLDDLKGLPDRVWDTTFAAHTTAWAREWEQCDVIIEGDEKAQIALRFNLYHLLIAAPRRDERVSIGAKTLSGYGYRGHAFWDTEIFMLPFFSYTRPEIARNLLSYRWHNLPGARKKASQNGFRGAQYPWESAATGEEVTPTWVPHPTERTQLIRIWTGDIEIHVSADIAYAVYQYWQTSGDDEFLCQRGAEMILETARFWADRAEWKAERGRYEFTNVIGPDEYHDHVDNNAYTNYFARWHLLVACQLVDWLKAHFPKRFEELTEQLTLESGELKNWQSMIDQVFIPSDPETGLIEQFDGYFNRREVNLGKYEDRVISMQALFGIEEINLTKVLKQPDVLMLLYLHPEAFDDQTVRSNYAYYTPRTDHTYGSSLGPTIQSIMACRVGKLEEAYEHFMRAACADLFDIRGNSKDGIHGASAGGLWQAVVFGFAGLQVNSAGWSLHPNLPPGWKRVMFKFCYHGKLQEVEVKNQDDPKSLHL
jgi:trehalose/maltose hydrolase-like predicted phosphorylase